MEINAQTLREIRDNRNLSQKEFAIFLGISHRSLQNYEAGGNIPDAKKLLIQSKISAENAHKEPVKNTNGNTYYEKGDGSYNVVAEVIPFDAYASYIETIEDASIHHDFEEVIFNVDRIGKGNYKAFRIKGDSMNGGSIDDVPDQALVLGRELGRHHWKDGFHKTKHGFIILCKENIFHKDIVDFDKETGDITCHSRNKSPEYSDFTINLNDVYQIFKIIKRFM